MSEAACEVTDGQVLGKSVGEEKFHLQSVDLLCCISEVDVDI